MDLQFENISNFFDIFFKKVLTKGKRCGNITRSRTRGLKKLEKSFEKLKKVLDKRIADVI